jgi:hypothetical protein
VCHFKWKADELSELCKHFLQPIFRKIFRNCNLENYWVTGLYPSSGIIYEYIRKKNFGNWICCDLYWTGSEEI